MDYRRLGAYVRASLVVFVLGILVWNVYRGWNSWVSAQSLPEPINLGALHTAESGALHEPALVEFYSNDCAICRRAQGPIAELDRQFDGQIRFIYIDTDLPVSQPSIDRYNARGLPTFVLLDESGRVVSHIDGWPGEQALDDVLSTLSVQATGP